MSQKLIVSSFTRTGTLHGGLRIEGGTGAGRKECPANNGPLVESAENVVMLVLQMSK
jgi:hypothetical protein